MTSRSLGLFALAVVFAAVGGAHAMTLSTGDANIVELLEQSSDIVVGHVASVTDGIDERGIPYTEVTLKVRSRSAATCPGSTSSGSSAC